MHMHIAENSRKNNRIYNCYVVWLTFIKKYMYFFVKLLFSGQPSYPKFKKCREKFLRECAEAKKSGEFTKMVHFYGTAFQNFVNLNAVFKVGSKVE